jgi:hypothetical protein
VRSPAARAAIAVVKRSSYSSTGTRTASASRAANARVSRVWAVSAPLRPSGRPTTTRSTSRSRTRSVTRAKPRRVAGRSIGSIGVARVPVGSLSAHPHRALP